MNRPHDDREIRLRRDYRWPPDRVFAAWTHPDALAAWFGPDGFETLTESFDFQVGGSWRFRMVHPERGTFQNHVRFIEIAPPERLVYEHLDGGERLFVVQVDFRPTAAGTTLEMCHRFPTAEACRRTIEEYGAVEGGRQTLARLERLLERG